MSRVYQSLYVAESIILPDKYDIDAGVCITRGALVFFYRFGYVETSCRLLHLTYKG